MKKHLLLLLLALAASVVQAQEGEKESFYTYMHHDSTGYSHVINSDMQQRDGNLVTEVFYIEHNGNYTAPFGYMLYKISPAPLAIIDTLFMADTTYLHRSFLARDPRGDGNIRAVYEYNEESDSSFVRISHFPDNDLNATLGEDVVVPLCEGIAYLGLYSSLVDSRGDLIMVYYKVRANGNEDEYVARIGLEGTLKHQALLAEDIRYDLSTIREFKESHQQYYQWGLIDYGNNPRLAVYVIDSLFQKNTVILNNILRSEEISPLATVYEYLNFNYDTDVLSNGGDEVLVAAQYTCDTNFYALTQDVGTAVAKYDLRTMQLKDYVVFNDFHYYSSTGYPLGFKKMGDGTLYFLYKEHLYPEESVIIVKMDTDFNVEWKRFCKTGDVTICPPFNPPIVLEDETGEETGIAWFGYSFKDGNYDKSGWVCFLVSHDGTVGINEEGVEVRPYSYWPNPARSELRLQFSPDVQPIRIELYDLQGRLVRSSDKGLEVLDIQGLASGQYVMKVTMDNGKVFTDKVVKE